jgi:flavin reductase (DIM6/NTAB) family NADH-FMN oxidoreductase RutF
MLARLETFASTELTFERLQNIGLLLASGRQGNLMTIGWGSVGVIWGKPIFLVMVRPSRYSFGLIEELGEFTVNVPGEEHEERVADCGLSSGREQNKADQYGFTLVKSEDVSVPYVRDCFLHYECRVIHKNDVAGTDIPMEATIAARTYVDGDYHRVFYGEILGVYRHE